MTSAFKVRKAAQVACFFAKAQGGSINVLKLTKLIYLADRRCMEMYERTILNDRFVSMPHGPVNTITLNYINGFEEDTEDWESFVSDRADHHVGCANADIAEDELDELSDAELEVLKLVWDEFGHRDRYWLRNYTHHHCPEWENPHGSSSPIPFERVMRYLGKDDPEQLAERMEIDRGLDRMLTAGE